MWVPGTLRHVRTARFTEDHEPWDIHPLNALAAVLVYALGWATLSVVLLLLLAVKMLPMLGRAYANHVSAFASWAPVPCTRGFKWHMSVGYVLAFALFPVLAALLVPGMIVYSAYLAAQAAMDTIAARGQLTPGWQRLRDGVITVRDGCGGGVCVCVCGCVCVCV